MTAALGLAICVFIAAGLFAVGGWLFWWAAQPDHDDNHLHHRER